MSKSEKKQKNTRTYIGGQAVMEGVMMRGKTAMATAVRDPLGAIQIEAERLTPPEKRSRFSRFPFVRGVVNFVQSLVVGNRLLLRSAEVAEGEDEQPSKAEKWLVEKHKVDLSGVFNTLAVLLGVLLALGIFLFLPQFLTNLTGLDTQGREGIWFNLAEGGIRLGIFILYLILTGFIPSIKRQYMYHGAEHKTITCFEKGLPMTTENVKSCSRVHDRCGTTFLFLVMVVSILVFSLANAAVGPFIHTGKKPVDFCLRFIFKLLLLPIVAGISYEILRLLAKTKNPIFFIFKVPGLLLQRLTTREPDERMIECAVTAFERVKTMDENPGCPECFFPLSGKLTDIRARLLRLFRPADIEEDEADWILSLTLKMPKSAVRTEERFLRLSKVKEIYKIADERLTGRPLWYIFGDTDFYGYKIKVDERVLIPRPETEELARQVIGVAEEEFKILDLCTGSGAIAIAVYNELKKRGKPVTVTASDVSEAALELAKENAELNGAEIKFVQSDMFSKIRGRYNIIVSNPPYIPTKEIDTLQREVKDFEPKLALDGGEDGLDFYRKIAADAGKYLDRGGMLILEVGIGQAEEVVKLFKYCDYSMVAKDFAGIDRFVKIVI